MKVSVTKEQGAGNPFVYFISTLKSGACIQLSHGKVIHFLFHGLDFKGLNC
ncbi:hypothetical protein Fmac_008126 [Flemingia macrophylla]|uniref:Uncharacterized protein n=1 Tax=Flemingia macrophylla TaxID=520843 RepID=A0ABD1MX25_9FABA